MMFEETQLVQNSLTARERACMRQCRQIRLKTDQGGGCPCDVLAECPFMGGPDDVWFPDNYQYWEDLRHE